ncbi:MAG: hypothetical protein M1826_004815 [Phylliscum demangeonii]|nr:MAG: hypothetical protein M1826_004815 [Phylliscum demangeonii]
MSGSSIDGASSATAINNFLASLHQRATGAMIVYSEVFFAHKASSATYGWGPGYGLATNAAKAARQSGTLFMWPLHRTRSGNPPSSTDLQEKTAQESETARADQERAAAKLARGTQKQREADASALRLQQLAAWDDEDQEAYQKGLADWYCFAVFFARRTVRARTDHPISDGPAVEIWIADDRINHLYTPGIMAIAARIVVFSSPGTLPIKMSKQLKEDVIEFLKGISDDRIAHLYTPGIKPGLLFKSELLRLDFQKMTSGKDDKRYNVHVQNNLR